jgi:hypothetical protein
MSKGDCKEVNIWVCASTDEEDVIETAIGEVIPGALISGPAGQILGGLSLQQAPVNHKYILPEDWHLRFPSGSEIIQYAASHYVKNSLDPDEQLLDRRRVEYDIFLLVEELHVLDIIRKGFGSVDEFIALANSVSNRRKSRAGKSLELHRSIYSLSTACDTLRRRPSQKVIKNPISFSLPQGLTTILSFP